MVQVWFALAAACCAGCAAGEDTPRERVCAGMCEAAMRCRTSDSKTRCNDSCLAGATGYDNVSDSGGQIFGRCLSTVACDALVSGTAHEDCWQAAKDDVEVSTRTRRFCDQYTNALLECGFTPISGECERDFAMWADHVLRDSSSCLGERRCEQLTACIDAVFAPL